MSQTNRYGYTLNRQPERKEPGRYHKSELLLMTTFQLREICRTEKIIQGIVNPMDKDELIRVILRYRGGDEYFFIKTYRKEGFAAIEEMMQKTVLKERQDLNLSCSSKITAYQGIAIRFYDGLTIPYEKSLAGTNALVTGGDGKLCAILNVEAKGSDTKHLYLTKASGLPCMESDVKNYSLYCMEKKESEMLYRLYRGNLAHVPENFSVCRIPLLDFEVKKPVTLSMPLAMDFGTANTTAGLYLDSQYFERTGFYDGEHGLMENAVNYTVFYDTALDYQETTLFPSVVGVRSVKEGEPEFLFGYEAERLADSSYIDEGFCVFYDIKRWIGDYEKREEITDSKGRRGFVKRKDILKAYLNYVIDETKNRFKCQIKNVHISCPVKQRKQFRKLFQEILPEYAIEKEDMIDEGVSVLYNTVSEMIKKGTLMEGQRYKALVIDCGGGTTDLCSCVFKVWDKRAAYRIEIETAYENGDTDFGGNNLTYRIMQLLKIAVADRIFGGSGQAEKEILKGFDYDIYRFVDEQGKEKLYEELEHRYEQAESLIPTRFREYEQKSREEYFKVKNNFYFLFHVAERVKKEFFSNADTLRITLSSKQPEGDCGLWLPLDRWKLSVQSGEGFTTAKEIPAVELSLYQIERLLRGDIYGIIRYFMEDLYEQGRLEEYSIIKLTGQSCKINLFRSALKEFVPGKTIQFKRKTKDKSQDYGLKMTCVDGALKYLRDKKYGFADISIRTKEAALPYQVTAYTHSGEEVVLIHSLMRKAASGMISRNMENLMLKLFLKDSGGRDRYQYVCYSDLSDFVEAEYAAIQEKYGSHIPQAETDDIMEREVKFFVWAEPSDWAFLVVPVYRSRERLFLGKEEEFLFENDNWVQNFFDGMK